MSARIEDGRLKIPFDGADTDRCYIAIGDPDPAEWLPAYKSYRRNGERVLQCAPPTGRRGDLVIVWLKINDYISRNGVLQL